MHDLYPVIISQHRLFPVGSSNNVSIQLNCQAIAWQSQPNDPIIQRELVRDVAAFSIYRDAQA